MHWHSMLIAAGRAFVAFTLALAATRFLNKQVVARLTYFDFTMGVMIGSLASHIPDDFHDPFLPVVIPLLVIVPLGVATGYLAMRHEPIRHFLQGEPTVIIQNGKILDENMKHLRYNLDQLNSQLRASGVFDVADVEFAVLEPGGQLSVQPKSQKRPVTPHDLSLATQYEGMAIELIMDGEVIHKNLRENGLSEFWLKQRLWERGISDPAQVYFAVLNTRGKVFVDLYRDEIARPIDVEGKNPSTPPSPSIT